MFRRLGVVAGSASLELIQQVLVDEVTSERLRAEGAALRDSGVQAVASGDDEGARILACP